MRILLTGSSGQVGGALLPLLQTCAEVVAPTMEELDLSKPETLHQILDELRPNLVVNPAAYTAVDRAEDEPELASRINAEAPAILARWAASHAVPLIHFSTDYVFDGSGTRPWREESLPRPLSVYGATKLAGDRAVEAAGGPHMIVRTSGVYAATGTNFVRTIARLAVEREELRVVADQIGAPTSARAIAHALWHMVLSDPSKATSLLRTKGGIVNVACAGETSWHGVATAVVARLKMRGVELKVERIVPIRAEEYPAKAKRPANSRLDLTRLKTVFGIEMQSWENALSEVLDEMIGPPIESQAG